MPQLRFDERVVWDAKWQLGDDDVSQGVAGYVNPLPKLSVPSNTPGLVGDQAIDCEVIHRSGNSAKSWRANHGVNRVEPYSTGVTVNRTNACHRFGRRNVRLRGRAEHQGWPDRDQHVGDDHDFRLFLVIKRAVGLPFGLGHPTRVLKKSNESVGPTDNVALVLTTLGVQNSCFCSHE